MKTYLKRFLIIFFPFLLISIIVKAKDNIKEYHYIWAENQNIFNKDCKQCNDSNNIYYLGKLIVDEDKKDVKFEFVENLSEKIRNDSKIETILNDLKQSEFFSNDIFRIQNILDSSRRKMISSELGQQFYLEKRVDLIIDEKLKNSILNKNCYPCKYIVKPLIIF